MIITMAKLINLYNLFFTTLTKYIEDIFLLFLRLYVADAFFRSGYIKLTSWDTTLYLFENEYSVPLLNFQLAAVLGTATELILPILLIFGLITRFSALALFVFNIVAIYSYPAIWANGFWDHKLWGIMMLVLVIYGSGKFAIDTILCKKC